MKNYSLDLHVDVENGDFYSLNIKESNDWREAIHKLDTGDFAKLFCEITDFLIDSHMGYDCSVDDDVFTYPNRYVDICDKLYHLRKYIDDLECDKL